MTAFVNSVVNGFGFGLGLAIAVAVLKAVFNAGIC